MGYLHIQNLYRDQTILIFREVFALEKIHGTSAHVLWKNGELHFFSGGEKHENFLKVFDQVALKEKFEKIGHPEVVVFGEAYGGKQQGQSWRYGKDLKFVAFDVKVGDHWLSVTNASGLVGALGLEFVHFARVSTDVDALNAERDAPSEQAKRNGVEGDKPREGVVLRPIVEVKLNDGSRIIAKHKRDEERETKTPRKIDDPEKLAVLEKADAIANEWVTPTRLEHVLDKLGADFPEGYDVSYTPEVIKRMIEDVTREAAGEIVDSKEARKAIGKLTAQMFQKRFKDALQSK